ncbi:MAG: DUF5685 family protein [Pseudomonadota bacterium]|nr:DUF5685 family protein [Pseudomonadota bacterium]
MIGYLAPYGPDDVTRRIFRSYQCGLCHTLGAEYGVRYRIFAGPDMVFLNVFYDLMGAGLADEGRRACVVAPVISSLPVRARTDHARFAAAFGVYMAVEKLRDDWEDERSWLKWLAWRAFRPGWVRARATLVEQGFPVASVEAWMRAQSTVEKSGDPSPSLAEASAPTRAIARILFGHAALTAVAGEAARPGLEALGDRVGGFLFYLDNLLDLPKDLRARGYNALARRFDLVAEPDRMPDEVLAAGIAGARAQVDDLEGLVATLPVSAQRGYITRTLVVGFRDKLRRYERLDATARRTATLGSVLPPKPTPTAVLERVVARPWARLRYRVQLTASLLAMWLVPRTGWAEDWWPEGADSASLDSASLDTGALDTAAVLDTASDPGGGLADTGDSSSSSDDCGNVCDPCTSNFGWVSCDSDVCTDPCSDACDSVCGAACDDACDIDCGDGCSC